MRNDFKIIVITSPDIIKDEAEKLRDLLDAGVNFIHIRKPEWTLREVKDLIEKIPYRYRKYLKLHGHFELLNEMNLAGVHLNSRNPNIPKNAVNASVSLHSINEISRQKDYEYATLSPIFDSISKYGYKSKFNIEKIGNFIKGKKIIALGGITPDKIFLLKEKGFYGAALLGYIWENDFEQSLNTLKEIIDNLN